MSFASLNRRITVREDVVTDGMEFKKLADFCGRKLHVDGFFFNEGRYGKQVVVVANGYLINFPSRAVETFEIIANDKDLLSDMLNGHMLIKDIREVTTKNGRTVSYTFADC